MAFRLLIWPQELGTTIEYAWTLAKAVERTDSFDRGTGASWVHALLAALQRAAPGVTLDRAPLDEWDAYRGSYRLGIVGTALLALVPFEAIENLWDITDHAVAQGLCVYAPDAGAMLWPGSPTFDGDRVRFRSVSSRVWHAMVEAIERMLERQVISGFDVLITCQSVVSADEGFRVLQDSAAIPAAAELRHVMRMLERAGLRMKSPPEVSGCVALVHVKDDWDWFVRIVRRAQADGLRTFDPSSGGEISIE